MDAYVADVRLVEVGVPVRDVLLERLVAPAGLVAYELDERLQPVRNDVDDLGAGLWPVRAAEVGDIEPGDADVDACRRTPRRRTLALGPALLRSANRPPLPEGQVVGILVVVLTLLLAAVILAAAVPKVVGQAQMRERMAHLGVSPARAQMIGGLELLAVAGLLLGLLWWPIAVAAAVGLTLLLIGAASYHARAKDPIPAVLVPVVFAVAAAVLAVLHVLNA